MSDKEIFYSKNAPQSKGPYSQAIIHKGILYLSGQIPIDPETGVLIRGSIEEETERVLRNIKVIVEEAGAHLEDILKTTCYLADLNDFERFNEVYKKFFIQNPPARTTIQAMRLPLNVQVEIDALVCLPEKRK